MVKKNVLKTPHGSYFEYDMKIKYYTILHLECKPHC